MKKKHRIHRTLNNIKDQKALVSTYFVLFIIFITIIILTLGKSGSNSKPANSPLPEYEIQVLTTPEPSPSPKPQFFIPENYGRSLRIPIIYYHYIGQNPNPEDKVRDALSVTHEKFEEQMKYLSQNNYTPITLDTMHAILMGNADKPQKPIVITFDDGYQDFYFNAYPILLKYNLSSTVFVPTSLIGTSYYMNWSQIRKLNQTNLVSFQAHSQAHPNLVSLTIDEAKKEISQSKIDLQNQLNKTVNFFAYPYGTSTPETWELVKQSGYVGAVGTWASTTVSEGNLYNMPRIRVGSNWTIDDFSSTL